MVRFMLRRSKHVTTGGTNFEIEYWGGEVAQVELVSAPENPLQTLIKSTRGYTGTYTNAEPTSEETLKFLADIQKTKLGTPLEFLNYVFLVTDVPRSWTHQAVRTRIGAAYVQESTRFLGSKGVYKVLVPKTAHEKGEVRPKYIEGIERSVMAYAELVNTDGVANQDARQLLPHALLTSMFWSINLKALMGIYEVRWCCQAEPSTWIPVMRQMKHLIEGASGLSIAGLLKAPIDRGQSCGFNASFDRPCVWKERKGEEEINGENL